MAVPSHPIQPLTKEALRSAALEARKAFVRTLDDAARTRLERRLARTLQPLLENVRVIAGYCPIASEISPLPALAEARKRGASIVYPAFAHPSEPFQFHLGDPDQPGPFGLSQPALDGSVLDPELVLVPLIAVDPSGTRLGRGKGHYDRVLARLRRNGARLVGIGWALQRLEAEIPRDPWDVSVDAFASPDGLEQFR